MGRYLFVKSFLFLMMLIFLKGFSGNHSARYFRVAVRIVECSSALYLGYRNAKSQLECSSWCSTLEECKRYNYCSYKHAGGICILHGEKQVCFSTNERHACICMVKKSVKAENGTYKCHLGFYGARCENIVKDCFHASQIPEVAAPGSRQLFIKPTLAAEPFEVHCRMQPDSLTALTQRTYSPICNNHFNKSWAEYRDGFGSFPYNYWLGLEKIYELANEPGRNRVLRIYVTIKGQECRNTYRNFTITPESDSYKIYLGGFLVLLENTTVCPEGLRAFNLAVDGQPFATYDHYSGSYNCPNFRKSGWWFAEDPFCTGTNLNGVIGDIGDAGTYWYYQGFGPKPVTSFEISLELKG